MCRFCEEELKDVLDEQKEPRELSIGVLGKLYFDQSWAKTEDPENPYKISATLTDQSKKHIYSEGFYIKFCPICGRDLREEV